MIAGILEELTIDYFRDVKDTAVGNSIAKQVQDALDDCVAIILVITRRKA